MQLVAYGAQDIYLTGNPQITFFKVVYRRHTNFSMESIVQTFSGSADFGGDVVATISRNGDLVHRMYLEHDAVWTNTGDSGANMGLVERYGDSLIKECEIEIGGQRIDKHTSMWNRVYSDLTEYNPSGYFGGAVAPVAGTAMVASNGTLHQLMTGNGYGVTSAEDTTPAFSVIDNATVNGFTYEDGASANGIITVNKIFLPLNFWFNRNPGLALPLIALQYHEVKVKMTFETHANLARNVHDSGNALLNVAITSAFAATPTLNLWCDYIYLDTDERRRFAQVSHEYLIEQLQFSDHTVDTQNPSIDLNFNHPVKELIWCTQNTGTKGRNGAADSDAGGSTTRDPTAGPVTLSGMGGNWQLKLNGHDRFKERDSKYFTRTQVWQHHTGYGALQTSGCVVDDGDLDADASYDTAQLCGADSIAVYSFALKPEEHQPSGTCNFSRIDNAQLVGSALTIEDIASTSLVAVDNDNEKVKLTIFAVNYNVLRIMSGMGGLAYSN